jgi:hypothetical protein
MTVLFVETKTCCTTSYAWAGALSWCRNHKFLCHLPGGLRRMFSLNRLRRLHYFFPSPSVLVEQIPYAWYFRCKKKLISHCSEFVAFSSVAVKLGVFHWNDSWLVSASCPNTQDSSPVMVMAIKLGSFWPVSSAQCRKQCGVPFDYSSVALAQILLQCASCGSHPTKFAGTFHTTARQCCKHCDSFVVGLPG